MSTGLIVVLVVVLVALIGAVVRFWWRRRTPEPLRGDWFSHFEREFHDWAASRHAGGRSRRPSRRDPL